MAPALRFATSTDGVEWGDSSAIPGGYSDYGHQMAVYRGELYGISVGGDKRMYASKYKVGSGWKDWRSLPEKFLSQGRCSVTVMNDRFYILRRGTNDAVYLCWTENFADWVDYGRIGNNATTKVAPAIASYNGRLFIAGAGGPDNAIYTTVSYADGTKAYGWKKVPDTGTRSALAMEVHANGLYLFHTGYNNGKIHYQYLTEDFWSSRKSVQADIKSGVSAVSWKYNTMAITYRNPEDSTINVRSFDGEKFSPQRSVGSGMVMSSQTGLATWGGALFVSYGDGASSSYRPHAPMSEKTRWVREEEVDDEWDVRWKNNAEQKSLVRKFFCL